MASALIVGAVGALFTVTTILSTRLHAAMLSIVEVTVYVVVAFGDTWMVGEVAPVDHL